MSTSEESVAIYILLATSNKNDFSTFEPLKNKFKKLKKFFIKRNLIKNI